MERYKRRLETSPSNLQLNSIVTLVSQIESEDSLKVYSLEWLLIFKYPIFSSDDIS